MARDPISIAFVGDIFLGQQPSVSLAPGVSAVLDEADLVVGNLEGSITSSTEPVGGKCCLKQAPESAATLRQWGVDVLSFANNHFFDYGLMGLHDARRALDEIGASYVGSGVNLAEATQPLILEIGRRKVGLLSYAWDVAQATCATEESFGCAPLDCDLMCRNVRELADQVDVAIVMPHWGYCDYLFPTPEQMAMADRLVEAGATAVVGHHSHVVQGIVRKGQSLIVYSIGNFVFAPFRHNNRPVDITRDNRNGVVLTLHLQPGAVISHDLAFTTFMGTTVELDDSRRRRKEFERRTAGVLAPHYDKYWRAYVRRRLLQRVFYWANPLNWRKFQAGHIIGGWVMLKKIFSRGT